MSSGTLCPLGGHVVDGKTQLPSDPVDHDVDGLPILGCNRLRCPLCHALVHSAAGVDFRDSVAKVDVAALYALEDLASSPLLLPRPNVRLYLCQCRRWPEGIGRRPVGDPEADAQYAPAVPWRCEGHPRAELPHDFDGVAVTPENVSAIVTRSLGGWTPPAAAPDDQVGGFWAARLHARLAGTPWQEWVAGAAAAALDDPDPATRGRALHFFGAVPLPLGETRALDLLGGDRAGYADVPDSITTIRADRTLEDGLWRLATRLVATPGRARDLARADALAPGKGRAAVFGALASGDPEWVAEHVEEIARANPAQAKALNDAIRYRFPARVPAKPVLTRLAPHLPH